MAEQKKTAGKTGPKASGTKQPAAGKKPAPKPASKPAGKPAGKPAPKKPAAAGKKGDGGAKSRPADDRKPSGSKPAPRKPSGAGGKSSGPKSAGKSAPKRPTAAGKPGDRPRDGGDRTPTRKPSGKPAAKKTSGTGKPQTHAERRREEKALAEPRAAKPRPATPRKAEGGAPKRLPKEAMLSGVQPQPKTVKRPGAKKAQRPDPASVRATMRLVAGWLHAKKALHILALDVAGLCSVAEGLVLCTARNVRQAQALADHLLKTAGQHGISYLGMEGYRTGGWVLIDLNDVLVHVFQEDTRRFYNLEGLWADAKPVALDLGPDEAGGDD